MSRQAPKKWINWTVKLSFRQKSFSRLLTNFEFTRNGALDCWLLTLGYRGLIARLEDWSLGFAIPQAIAHLNLPIFQVLH